MTTLPLHAFTPTLEERISKSFLQSTTTIWSSQNTRKQNNTYFHTSLIHIHQLKSNPLHSSLSSLSLTSPSRFSLSKPSSIADFFIFFKNQACFAKIFITYTCIFSLKVRLSLHVTFGAEMGL